jgi:hypothetical protein
MAQVGLDGARVVIVGGQLEPAAWRSMWAYGVISVTLAALEPVR